MNYLESRARFMKKKTKQNKMILTKKKYDGA